METSHSNELGLLFEALSKAQGKIENALKDKKNPFFKSNYADLSSVWDACRSPLSSNGLSVIQTVEGNKEQMFLLTWLGHSSGQWMKSKLPLVVAGNTINPQAIGSAITYARRYALSALVGICADEDDDGEKAMSRKNGKNNSTHENQDTQEENQEEIKRKLEERGKQIIEKIGKENKPLLNKYVGTLKSTYPNKTEEEFFLKETLDKFIDGFEFWKNKQMTAA